MTVKAWSGRTWEIPSGSGGFSGFRIIGKRCGEELTANILKRIKLIKPKNPSQATIEHGVPSSEIGYAIINLYPGLFMIGFTSYNWISPIMSSSNQQSHALTHMNWVDIMRCYDQKNWDIMEQNGTINGLYWDI